MPYQSYTRAQLRTLLADRYDDTPFWSSTDANDALNEALLLWNALTAYWREPITPSTIPGDPYVPLASTMVQGTRVSWAERPLVKTSVTALDHTIPNWQVQTVADGGAVPTRPQLWAPVALNLLVLWPAPADARLILVDGVRATPQLTDDAQYADIGDEEINVLLGYALHSLTPSAGTPAIQRTTPLYQAFMEAAKAHNRQLQLSKPFEKRSRGDWMTQLARAGDQG